MKNILITGASGNLGKATVATFLKEGYNVIVIVSPGKKLSLGKDVQTYEANLTDEQACQKVITEILASYPHLHAALLLVGGYAPGTIQNSDSTALKKMMSLNFDTSYFIARPLFQHMLSQSGGGRIIFVGSRSALKPKEGKNAIAYALSKSLIFKLAELLNAEGASKNVTASVIVPSIIDTKENRAAMPDKDFTMWVKPEDIAKAMVYLCSEEGLPLRETVLKIYNRA